MYHENHGWQEQAGTFTTDSLHDQHAQEQANATADDVRRTNGARINAELQAADEAERAQHNAHDADGTRPITTVCRARAHPLVVVGAECCRWR